MTDSPLPPGVVADELAGEFSRPAYVDEVESNAMLDIELVDGRPMIRSIYFHEAVDPVRLVQVDWPAHVNFAVRMESLIYFTDGTLGAITDPVQRATADRVARRYYVSDKDVATAAAGARRGDTVKQIAETLQVSERTAQRYLARAREKGALR
jgi:hypothetical protein